MEPYKYNFLSNVRKLLLLEEKSKFISGVSEQFHLPENFMPKVSSDGFLLSEIRILRVYDKSMTYVAAFPIQMMNLDDEISTSFGSIGGQSLVNAVLSGFTITRKPNCDSKLTTNYRLQIGQNEMKCQIQETVKGGISTLVIAFTKDRNDNSEYIIELESSSQQAALSL